MAKRASQSSPKKNVICPEAARDWLAWLRGLLCWLVFAAIVVRPIAYPGTWWELSRGRAVAEGRVDPSRSVLVADERFEADWLGGLAFYLAYSALGASGLMVCRLALLAGVVAVAAGILGRPRSLGRLSWPELPLVAVASWGADACPGYWDLAGLSLMFFVAWRSAAHLRRHDVVGAIATTVFWANLGPRFIFGPFVWIAARLLFDHPVISSVATGSAGHAGEPIRAAGFGRIAWTAGGGNRVAWWQQAATVASMGLAGCLTPRGVAGWWDSARILFPRIEAYSFQVFASLERNAGMGGWPLDTTLFVTLVGVTGLAILALDRLSARQRFALTIFGCLAATSVIGNEFNGYLATFWVGWLLLGAWSSQRLKVTHDAVGTASDEPQARVAGKSPVENKRVAVLLAFEVLAVASVFWGTNQLNRIGWGLDSRLDDRLMRLAWKGVDGVQGIAWSDDLEAIGMWVWVTEGHYPAHDAPHRALLGGRYDSMRRLGSDLRQSRQSRYFLEDGSTGGWWLGLSDRKVSLVLANSRDVAMVRGLLTTIWQPLSLDSPVLPYARAGDRPYQRQLLLTVNERDFVELGSWQYQGPTSSGSDFDRDRGFWQRPIDAGDISLRQARTFRALGLPVAALRVLNWVRRNEPSEDSLRETANVHRDLSHQEWLTAGAVVPFREPLLASLDREPTTPGFAKNPMELTASETTELERSVALYRHGDVAGADQIWQAATSDAGKLIGATLAWELGDMNRANSLFGRIVAIGEPGPASRLAQAAIQKLSDSGGEGATPKPDHAPSLEAQP